MTFRLDHFEGPLDLLLHLISKNKVSIYDIPIAEILEQYMTILHESGCRGRFYLDGGSACVH